MEVVGNTLAAIEHPTSDRGPRHGGRFTQRHHTVVVNGIVAEKFTEGLSFGWATGPHYVNSLADRIAWWERLLGCRAVRGRSETKQWDFGA